MEKDFNKWNEHKKRLEKIQQPFLFKQGEVWWCSIGVNVAEESCGKGEFFGRPVLVLKKLSRRNYIGIPLSTKRKIGTWFMEVTVQGKTVSALLYQIRMLSTNRFQRRLTTLDTADFARVKEKLEALLGLS
ncbi:MAG: type II toxin-antitoxin system PemK/MazF family toxin [Patescibacteria group bacterium]